MDRGASPMSRTAVGTSAYTTPGLGSGWRIWPLIDNRHNIKGRCDTESLGQGQDGGVTGLSFCLEYV